MLEGRELLHAVLRKMGWLVTPCSLEIDGMPSGDWYEYFVGKHIVSSPPNYHHDLNALFRDVVPKMRNFELLRMNEVRHKMREDSWLVCCGKFNAGKHEVEVMHTSAPTAICNAFLEMEG